MTAVAITTLVGCATIPMHSPQTPRTIESSAPPESGDHPQATTTRPLSCCRQSPAERNRLNIVRSATRLVGATTITSEGRRITYDCAGVTRAVFLKHGVDLYDGGDDDSAANGVRLIYNHVRRLGVLHQDTLPRPGDLVFFDNTWDFNGDGRLNDPLTHVGIVERTDSDGTVVFISRVAGAVERYRMNLSHPHVHKTADGRLLNDYIRRKLPSDPPGTGRLTGELFASYGTRLPL